MAKIIDSVVTFYGGGERLDISLLSSKSFYAVKLSKPCNVKILLIGNRRESSNIVGLYTVGLYIGEKYYGSWCPLGFNRGVVYG